jgi:hypothetical protein
MDSRNDLDEWRKEVSACYWNSNPGRPVHSLVTILIFLFRSVLIVADELSFDHLRLIISMTRLKK